MCVYWKIAAIQYYYLALLRRTLLIKYMLFGDDDDGGGVATTTTTKKNISWLKVELVQVLTVARCINVPTYLSTLDSLKMDLWRSTLQNGKKNHGKEARYRVHDNVRVDIHTHWQFPSKVVAVNILIRVRGKVCRAHCVYFYDDSILILTSNAGPGP